MKIKGYTIGRECSERDQGGSIRYIAITPLGAWYEKGYPCIFTSRELAETYQKESGAYGEIVEVTIDLTGFV